MAALHLEALRRSKILERKRNAQFTLTNKKPNEVCAGRGHRPGNWLVANGMNYIIGDSNFKTFDTTFVALKFSDQRWKVKGFINWLAQSTKLLKFGEIQSILRITIVLKFFHPIFDH